MLVSVFTLFIVLFGTMGNGETLTGFNSVFISIDGKIHGAPWFFARTQWHDTMKLLRDIGVSTVILSNSVTEKNAHYPTKIPGLAVVSKTTIQDVLETANQFGINVWLGIALRNEWFYDGNCVNTNFVASLVSDMSVISKELYSFYGHLPSFTGLYNTAEIWSQCCLTYCNSTMAARIGKQFVEPLGKVVKGLNSKLVYSIAPYYQNSTSPDEQVSFWNSVLSETQTVDVIMFQDGVGVQHVLDPQQTMEYIKPLSELVHSKFGHIKFWTDLEIFRKYPLPRVPAPWSRVLEQIELETPYIDGLTQWEFWSYMDPRNPKASPDLYKEYSTWYHERKDEHQR